MTHKRAVPAMLLGCGLWAVSWRTISAQDSTRGARPPVHVRAGRLLGVYDEASGAPIEGAEVQDVSNGLSALTTKTGTLTLFFVDTSGSIVQIRKLGYQPLLLPVANSPRDTTPLTVTLSRSAVALTPVVSTAHSNRGPADTVRALEQGGFYDRRVATAAPGSAFLTADRISRLATIGDVGALTGRPLCTNNLWVNGVRTTGMPVKQLDHVYGVDNIIGVEQYVGLEVPSEFKGGGCATLIWTK